MCPLEFLANTLPLFPALANHLALYQSLQRFLCLVSPFLVHLTERCSFIVFPSATFTLHYKLKIFPCKATLYSTVCVCVYIYIQGVYSLPSTGLVSKVLDLQR